MQIKETLSKDLKREYTVTIPAKTIEAALTKELEAIGNKAKIPGFRPGKIPLTILKQRYQNEALSEVLEKCIEDAISQLLKEKDLRPSLRPSVEIKSFDEGKDLAVDIKMEVLPTLKDIKIDGLTFDDLKVQLPPERVEEAVKHFANRHKETHPLKKPRKTKKGDVAVIDFEGYIGKEPIEGGSDKDHHLELGSGTFIPGFEEQLLEKEKGDKVEVKVTFPDNYPEARYAAKPARFDVTIKDIHETKLPELNAEFAKKFGFETIDELKKAFEKRIIETYETQGFMNLKRHVLDELANRFQFDVPENMVKAEFDNIWNQLCQEIGVDQGESANANVKGKVGSATFKEATGKTEEELRREYELIAERRVRLGILLAEIGNRNDISVSSQELSAALMEKARHYPGQEKEVFDYYRNNRSALESLRAPLYENKIIEFILEKSKLKEKKVSPEEFEKLMEKEESEAEKKIATQSKKAKAPAKKEKK